MIFLIRRFISLVILFMLSAANLRAGVEIIPSGSFIINHGITPQSIGNSLKPYGLVYDLLQNYSVPVKWVISPNKAKDGIDFSYNNTNYRAGTFIILAQYRTSQVNAAIKDWLSRGVVGENTTIQLSLEVYATLSYAPKWTIDMETGSLVTPFFENAGIPASAHGGLNRSSWKRPDQLTECDDIFALPHSDPSWSTHNNLLSWNRDFKGAIWSGCHAVSVMENIVSPDGLTRMNFLSTDGLVDYRLHTDGNAPYTYTNSSDPVMQFMGGMDDAAVSGSESIYLPKPGGSWRPGITLSVTDPDHPQIPSLSPGPAAIVAYGYAFNDESRGLVMYQGGHFHNGGTGNGGLIGKPFNSDHVALQRAFFNFSFLAVIDRQRQNFVASINAPETVLPGNSYPISFAIPSGVDLSQYTVRWATSAGTISPGSDDRNIIFTPPTTAGVRIVLITLFIKDACGREFFTTQNVRIFREDEDISVIRLVSANEDGLGHDYLYIKNIELYPNNEIQIFNRWGILVSIIKNYDNSIQAFRGFGNQKSSNDSLIDGVYYYILKARDDNGVEQTFKDFFVLKR